MSRPEGTDGRAVEGREAAPGTRGKRLLVVGFGKHIHAELMRRLARRRNWSPAYWVGGDLETRRYADAHFAGVLHQSLEDAVRLRLPDALARAGWPRVDAAVVERLAPHEPILFAVFLREARRGYGLDQLNEYHQRITLWYHLFRHLDPQVVLFEQTPTHVHDYLIYLLCRELSVPRLILLQQHHFPDTLLPIASLEEPPARLERRFRSLVQSGAYREVSLSPRAERYLERMRGSDESAMYDRFRRRYRIDESTRRLKLRDTLWRKLGDVLRGRSSTLRTRELAMELRTYPQRLRLRRDYESRATEPDYGQPCVFVPLQVQPERTTMPLGGLFGHQLLIVDILSRAVPQGWRLYVKEHPSQLYYRPYYRAFRSTLFYDDLLAYPNVRLVPARIPSFALIEHAKAVASATSTALWEGVQRGVPALAFGHAWFRGCEGVFYTPDYERCRQALARIEAGYRVDPEKVRAFVYALEQESAPAVLGPRLRGMIDEMGFEAAMERVVDAVCERLPPDFVEAEGTPVGQRAPEASASR